MERMGLMIDYEYCTGCHTCEVACKQEHTYPVGRGGIRLTEFITERPDQSLRIDYLPFTTMYCNLCSLKTARGERPACVQHCQAACMYYGSLSELARLMETRPRSVLFAPR
jgi:Fe-S-cluster-containing dehydrogenase component